MSPPLENSPRKLLGILTLKVILLVKLLVDASYLMSTTTYEAIIVLMHSEYGIGGSKLNMEIVHCSLMFTVYLQNQNV